jgi:hypothetical protein
MDTTRSVASLLNSTLSTLAGCLVALTGLVLLVSGTPAYAASRPIRTDNPTFQCDLGYWAAPNPNTDMYSSVDGNADGTQNSQTFFNPGTTVTTPASYCVPTMALLSIWYSPTFNGNGVLEANNDPANPASDPVTSGDAEGLPTDFANTATSAFMYEWAPSPTSTSPQAELFIWTLPSGDLELTFQGWCANASATASFTWMGNVYTSTNCAMFSGADLLINSQTGLPDGEVTNPADQIDGQYPDWQVTEFTITTITLPVPAVANTPFTVNVQVTATDGSIQDAGMVQLSYGSTVLGPVAINPMTNFATFSVPAMPAGTALSLTAYYEGVANQTLPSHSTDNNTPPYTVTVQLPAPTLTFTPATITLGQSSTLTWSSVGATSCNAYAGSWNGLQATSGSIKITPTTTGAAFYGLFCTNGTVSSLNGTATLTVNTPAPAVTVTVSPASITAGQSATLTWSSTNAASCMADSAWSGAQATSGTLSVTPASAGGYAYSLTCTGTGGVGNGATALIVTAVQPPPATAPSVTVTVSPGTVTVGQSATVTWTSTNATSCVADSAWSGTQATNGTLSVSPTTAGGYAYSLTCTGAGGAANGAAALVVTAAPTPAATAPTVTVMVSPSTLTVGQSATVTWSSTNATSCVADSAWSGAQALSGTLSVSPGTAGAYAYSLNCTGAGGTANGAAALSVVAASATTTAPATSSSSKGGGGGVNLGELIALAGMIGLRMRRSIRCGGTASQ